MKTAEDEAFEDIERKQGGFHAKRQAAIDKVNSDFDGEYIKYREAFPKGYTAPQPAQDPVECLDCGSNNVGIPATYDSLVDSVKSQPVQEPVAWTLLLTGEHHGIIGKAGEKFIGAPECYQRIDVYTTPPRREWVGLTDEEIIKIHDAWTGKNIGFITGLVEAKLKEKNG